VGESQLPIVKALVESQPDALLVELCERFAQKTGVHVSVSTMQRATQRLELSVKKNIDCR
jgi:transposase